MRIKERKFIPVLVVYLLILIYVLFLKNVGNSYPYTYTEYIKAMVNLIPFKSIYVLTTNTVVNSDMIISTVINLAGNIIIFLPWGLFSVTFDMLRGFKKYFIYTLVCILAFELIQLFAMLGIFDIEDIILNLSGALLGYWLTMKLCGKKQK